MAAVDFLLILFCLSLALFSGAASVGGGQPESNSKKTASILYKSQRVTQPTRSDGAPIEVVISMFIEDISDFSMKTMDFRLDAYFQQRWTDDRLKHNGTERLMINDRSLLRNIWLPDIYFANSRKAGSQDLKTGDFLLWIYPDGSLLYDFRVAVTVLCGMDFYKWPLDSQLCDIRIMSYAYEQSQLILKWNTTDPPLQTDERIQLQLPDVKLIHVHTGTCNGTYTLGTWSCVTAEFLFARRVMHYVLQCYFPTTIIVMTSWCSFWLDVTSTPGRVILSITTLLTLMTQANSARLQLPEVSKMKAIDVWMGTCMVFVFCALLEFIFANYAQRMEENRGTQTGGQRKPTVWSRVRKWMVACLEPKQAKEAMGLSAMVSGNELLLNIGLDEEKRKVTTSAMSSKRLAIRNRKEQRARDWLNRRLAQQRKTLGIKAAERIDRKARRIFPCAFFVFSVAYWVYYLLLA